MPTEPIRLALPPGLDLPGTVQVRGLGLVAESTVESRVSSWDTPDGRLERSGVRLSKLDGEWVLRLPAGEVRAAGSGGEVPEELLALVTGWVRTAPVGLTRTERTHRTRYRLADADGVTTAQLIEEVVSTAGPGEPDEPGELPVGGRRVLTVRAGPADSARLVELLTGAGAAVLAEAPDQATGPDRAAQATRAAPATAGAVAAWPVQPELSPDTRSAVVLARVLTTLADRLVGLHLPVRRGEEDAVHQMRVTCRRLRAALRTFRPLLAPGWAEELSAELAWLAGALGAARDLEVLRLRVVATAGSDPDRPIDGAALARVHGLLLAREDAAQDAAAEAMGSDRYTALLERVVRAGHSPAVSAAAAAPAGQEMLPLVGAAWRKLAKRARALGPHLPDEAWHRVRILAKRARYACENAELAFGSPARRLARRLTRVQDHLGEHQDAILAVTTLLDLARQHPSEPDLAVACGRLVEREYRAAHAARAAFHREWSTVDRPRYTGWLDG